MRIIALIALLGGFALTAAPRPQPRVSIDMTGIPMGELIRYVCSAARASYKIENNTVVMSHRKSNFNSVSTRFYRTSAQFLSTLPTKGGAPALTKHFENMGMSFGEGAKVAYLSRRSMLVVTNTTAQFRKLERLLDELDGGRWMPAAEDPVHKKLREIVVTVTFENATLPEIARHLHKRSRELDPDGEGINIYYLP